MLVPPSSCAFSCCCWTLCRHPFTTLPAVVPVPGRGRRRGDSDEWRRQNTCAFNNRRRSCQWNRHLCDFSILMFSLYHNPSITAMAWHGQQMALCLQNLGTANAMAVGCEQILLGCFNHGRVRVPTPHPTLRLRRIPRVSAPQDGASPDRQDASQRLYAQKGRAPCFRPCRPAAPRRRISPQPHWRLLPCSPP